MQAERMRYYAKTMNRFEQGAIEEGALTSFNIAIEQFHRAVADRQGPAGDFRPRKGQACRSG